MTTQTTEAVRKSVTIDLPPEEAFDLFTERMGDWWPLETHSLAGERAETARVEPRVGGRVYERARDGDEAVWGEVLAWEPPHRVAFDWRVHRGGEVTEVDVRFSPEGSGTRVDLEHRGWGVFGDGEARASYDTGWETVLGRYAGAA